MSTLERLEADARQPANANNSARRLRIIDAKDIKRVLSSNYIVKTVITRNTRAVIYGSWSTGKTFLAIDLAMCVATGREWCGKRVRQGQVVYVAAEAGATIQNRIEAWKDERWDGQEDIWLRLVPDRIDLSNPLSVDENELIAIIDKADLVVIDTVAATIGNLDENKANDVGKYMNAVARIQKACECTVLLVHHTGKDTSRGMRGSSNFGGDVDTAIFIEKEEDGEIATVYCPKQRDGARFEPMNFMLREVVLGEDDDGDDVTTCVIDLTDPPEKAPQAPKGKAKDAFDILVRLVHDRQSDRVPDQDWRMAIVGSAAFRNSSNPNQDHKRQRKALQKNGLITIDGDMIVITPNLPF
jgi:hypothetical protein